MEEELSPCTVYYLCNDEVFINEQINRFGKATEIQKSSKTNSYIPKILFLKENSAKNFYESMKKEEFHEKIFVSREPIKMKVGSGPLVYWNNIEHSTQKEYINNDILEKFKEEIDDKDKLNLAKKPVNNSQNWIEPVPKGRLIFAMGILSSLIIGLAILLFAKM